MFTVQWKGATAVRLNLAGASFGRFDLVRLESKTGELRVRVVGCGEHIGYLRREGACIENEIIDLVFRLLPVDRGIWQPNCRGVYCYVLGQLLIDAIAERMGILMHSGAGD